MDEDRSGGVTYAELVDNLYKMKMHDDHALLIFLKQQLQDLRGLLSRDMAEMLRHNLEFHTRFDELRTHLSNPNLSAADLDGSESATEGCMGKPGHENSKQLRNVRCTGLFLNDFTANKPQSDFKLVL